MLVDVVARFDHYRAHLAPIASELHRRGHTIRWWSTDGARGAPSVATRRSRPDITLVASHHDARRVADEPVVYVEHGVGQTYTGRGDPPHDGWPGGGGLDHAVVFIAPSGRVARLWEARYPDARVAVVGCPFLDAIPVAHHAIDRPTIAVSFRWYCDIAPEAASAFPHYRPFLREIVAGLRAQGFARVIGHGHPRLQRRLVREWSDAGAEFIASWSLVLDVADVFAADNTSALYEFAATGRPVVVLNAPWYDRDVEHGLRFWTYVPGVMVDDPLDMPAAASLAIADPPALSGLRFAAVNAAYSTVDGNASRRAADAIERTSTW